MTELKQAACKEIKVPLWIISVLMGLATIITTILIVMMGHVFRQGHIQGQMIEQISRMRLDLDKHILITRGEIKSKADIRDIERVYQKLDNIEAYLKK